MAVHNGVELTTYSAKEGALRALQGSINANLTQNVINAMQRGAKGSGNIFRAFGKGLEVNFGDDADVAEAHKTVAAHMLEATRKAYHLDVEGSKTYHAYEREGRLHGGMRRALADDSQALGTARGIFFVNRSVFAKEAKHWKRLNFGAGGIAGSPKPRVPLKVLGRSLFNVGFRAQADRPFFLPPGFFLNPETGAWVGPSGKHPTPSTQFSVSLTKSTYTPQLTRGIKGRHFLEAGVNVLAEELGLEYARLLKKWLGEADERARAVQSENPTFK